ncbi:transposable element Tcb1 transposase [Trichonephila clavipes]|uniref:Transposable element Tcb1 transposase n=1 Tax=Trichonephila clavipes TaxID=2585209 RepID=A0A8X6VJF0_TRICX|nr:transposable element Tcb1 transposase [Trichonephila clavipes]
MNGIIKHDVNNRVILKINVQNPNNKKVPNEDLFSIHILKKQRSESREIGSRVGRNQTTVMRICDRWMQEGTTDRRGRSHPPQCPTSRENRQMVRVTVTDRLVTSRTVAQHIESVTHHSVSVRTIRRRLQQSGLSARRPLLGLPFMQNHRRLHPQWCDERRMWVAEWNEAVFTDESRICCNTTMVGFESGDTVERGY